CRPEFLIVNFATAFCPFSSFPKLCEVVPTAKRGEFAFCSGVWLVFKSFGPTSPLMKITAWGVAALEITEIDLWNGPGRPLLLYMALITPVLPGMIGSFVH